MTSNVNYNVIFYLLYKIRLLKALNHFLYVKYAEFMSKLGDKYCISDIITGYNEQT